jgi:hypothetical protein
METYFACTNNGTFAATVGGQVYDSSGAPLNAVGATQLTLNPNETRLFGTSSGVGAFFSDSNLNASSYDTGSAQILASVSKRISCSSWMFGLGAGMTSLQVVKKNAQKGE